ncbi:MAG: hypothetical protein U9R19_05930, partial [Bacteroidota bacterium]|nr:hypothetical protein [Bacteroidota bacterium]
MKKSYLLLLALVFASINSFSQTVIYTNDFESYTAGTGIASQAGTPWTTWSNAPGGSEDPVISTDYALSGTNSIKVVSNNDLILDLADLTTGRYQIEFNMYVATGKIAYINLLQNFAGQNSEWATQTYFNVDGSSTTDANGESTGSFTFLHNTWINVNYIVDLDDDFASLYVDSVEIVSWKWSMGSFGSSSLHKLDALNIFGWTDDNNNTSLFYVDDIKVLQNQTLDAPTNLTATVTNSDIDLAWTAPTTLPDNYSLMRNGDVISSTITTTTYSETGMYPMNYDYMVRAHYNGLGYSASSNTATALVLGGVDRNLVLYEINTGTWCGYCPGAAMGADDL